ncbi:MAG: integrase [Chlamydiales bacterium]|jgi:integrase
MESLTQFKITKKCPQNQTFPNFNTRAGTCFQIANVAFGDTLADPTQNTEKLHMTSIQEISSPEAKEHTFADLIDRYVENILPPRKRSSQERYTHLEWWKERLGSYLLSEVTPAVIAQTRDCLAKATTCRGTQRSPAQVVRHLASLSHAFTIAVKEWEWVEDNPLRKVTKPKENRKYVHSLSEESQDRLLQACKNSSNPHLYTVVMLALSTGMCQREILKLTWADLDTNNERITLHETKDDEIRVFPLKGLVLSLLKDYERSPRFDAFLLFPSSKVDKYGEVRSSWDKAVAEAGVENFKFQDLSLVYFPLGLHDC